MQPFVGTGQSANNALAGLLGTGGDPNASANSFSNYLNSTNYKFQLGQGLQGIEYANAPAFTSGATAKALNNYAQGQAGTALAGYEGMLQGQSNTGEQAGSSLAGVGTNIAGQNASAQNNNAAGQASGAAGTSNAATNALTGLSKLINQQNTQSSFGAGANAFVGQGETGTVADLAGLL